MCLFIIYLKWAYFLAFLREKQLQEHVNQRLKNERQIEEPPVVVKVELLTLKNTL